MTLNPSLMRNLDNRELLRFLESGDDPLTTTDLERELTTRLRNAQDELDELQTVRDTCDSTGVEASDIKELLEILSEFCVENPAALREKLERSDKFYDIAQEGGDIIERLNTLAKTTL